MEAIKIKKKKELAYVTERLHIDHIKWQRCATWSQSYCDHISIWNKLKSSGHVWDMSHFLADPTSPFGFIGYAVHVLVTSQLVKDFWVCYFHVRTTTTKWHQWLVTPQLLLFSLCRESFLFIQAIFMCDDDGFCQL